MTSKSTIAYHNIVRMLNNHCLAFSACQVLEEGASSINNQLYAASLLAAAADEKANHTTGLNRPSMITTKSNTNMHNYEHTFLHNLLPSKN